MAFTSVLAYASFECKTGGSDKVYYLQLIATSGGYQVLAQHGRRGASLRCIEKTPAHVPYHLAETAYSKACSDRIEHDYDHTLPSLPSVEPFTHGAYEVVAKDKKAEFIANHDAVKVPDPTRGARTARRAREIGSTLGKLLAHPRTSIVDPAAKTDITVTKNGGQIEVSSTDPHVVQVARRAALEIGGTVTLEGAVEDDVFLVNLAHGVELDAILARARPNVVRRAASSTVTVDKTQLFADFLKSAQPELLIRDAAGAQRTFVRADVIDALPHLPDAYKGLA